MTKMLEGIEAKLDRIIFLLEKNSGDQVPSAPTLPDFSMPSKSSNGNTCHQCGINLSGTMGYVCKNAACPTGLGTTAC